MKDICRKKVAWMDEQAGDFLAFIMAELITMRRSFFFIWTGGEGTILSFLAPWLNKRVQTLKKPKKL